LSHNKLVPRQTARASSVPRVKTDFSSTVKTPEISV